MMDAAVAKTSPASSSPPSVERHLAKRTLALLVISSICTAILLTYITVKQFQEILLPEILSKTGVIGKSVQKTLDEALELQVPYDSLVGAEDFLKDTLRENPEIAFIKIANGAARGYEARQGAPAEEVITQNIPPSPTGIAVTIGVRSAYLNEKLYIMFGDAIVVLFVALVAGLEVALFFAYKWLIRPWDTLRAMLMGIRNKELTRDLINNTAGPFAELLHLSNQQIAELRKRLGRKLEETIDVQDWYRPTAVAIRASLFLFILSEELLRSFFPLYVREFVDTAWALGPELAISVPLIVYMFFAGGGTLFSGNLIDRVGLRRAFGLSVLGSVVALCGLAAASTWTEIVFWRSISALSYAVATIACQVFVARSDQGEGKPGMATFVAAGVAACVCGAPIGALLADVFGKQVALLLAAGVATLAWLAFRTVPMPVPTKNDNAPEQAIAEGNSTDTNGRSHFRLLISNWRVMVLMLAACLPSKMLLGGMVYFVTPLLLKQYGLPEATIGQFFMLYYGFLLIGNSVGSRFVTAVTAYTRMIVIGGILSGAGAITLFWYASPLILAIAVTSFGIGQSLMLTPVTTLLLHTVKHVLPEVPPSRAIALQRAFERVGGMLGAFLAALLSASFGFVLAAAILGVMATVIGLGTISLLRPLAVDRQQS